MEPENAKLLVGIIIRHFFPFSFSPPLSLSLCPLPFLTRKEWHIIVQRYGKSEKWKSYLLHLFHSWLWGGVRWYLLCRELYHFQISGAEEIGALAWYIINSCGSVSFTNEKKNMTIYQLWNSYEYISGKYIFSTTMAPSTIPIHIIFRCWKNWNMIDTSSYKTRMWQ